MFLNISKIVGYDIYLSVFTVLVVSFQMMWAADFNESLAYDLEENCLEALMVQLPSDSGAGMRDESADSGSGEIKGGLQQIHGNLDRSISDNVGMKSASSHHFCGLTRSFWSRNDQMQNCAAVSSTKKGVDELPVFCVAAVLIMNRHKIIRETHSIDDMIKARALCFHIHAWIVIKLNLLLAFHFVFVFCFFSVFHLHFYLTS